MDAANNLATYGSGGVQVTGAFYRPSAIGYQPQPTGPFPAVLVVHTQGGLSSHERIAASWLATQGYVVLAPDYFTPVGLTPQTFQVASFWAQHTDRVREHLARGLDCLKSLPYVDKQRIGVVGFSLGGYLSLVLATREDVKAVVSYYGAYHGGPVDSVSTLYPLGDIIAQVRAPILMLHGQADTTIPILGANTTQLLLVARRKQSELVVYPGVEHQFDQVSAPYYNGRVTADAQARTLAFLKARLQ